VLKIFEFIGQIGFWLLWPIWRVALPRTKRSRVLVLHDSQLLLVKNWLSDGKWALPGGGIKCRESAADGAVREVREETGLSLDGAKLQACGSLRARRHGLAYEYQLFVIQLSAKLKASRHLPEIYAAEWHELSSLDNPDISPEVRKALAAWSR
jgi:8-oxo-dGTP diphosphatase